MLHGRVEISRPINAWGLFELSPDHTLYLFFRCRDTQFEDLLVPGDRYELTVTADDGRVETYILRFDRKATAT